MTTTVKQVRELLERAARPYGGDKKLAASLNAMFTELKRLDDHSFQEVLNMLAVLQPTYTVREERPSANVQWVEGLTQAFFEDARFGHLLRQLETDRATTKDDLNQIYNALFDKSRKLPSKATRASLIRDISDVRVERVRSRNAARLLTGSDAS